MGEELDAIRLEHRLTKVEEAIVANTLAVDNLARKVGEQNGRVSRLEQWRSQILAVVGIGVFLAPFVFYAIMRAFPA